MQSYRKKEAVENPNAIFDSINRTAECEERSNGIPEHAAGSGHMQFYAQSCEVYFKRGTGKIQACLEEHEKDWTPGV